MRLAITLILASSTTLAVATETPRPKAEGVLLTGDSMIRVGLAPVLKAVLADELDETVTMHAKSATGLARPDSYNWLTELPKALKDQHFLLAVVSFGSNDCQNLTGEGEKALAYATPAWDTAYRTRVKSMLTLLCGAADQVVWLGLPPMRNAKFNGRVTAMNELLEEEVKGSTCAQFVATAPKLADAKGHFAQILKVGKHKLKVREDDGVHLTQNGGKLVAELVLGAVKK